MPIPTALSPTRQLAQAGLGLNGFLGRDDDSPGRLP
jgi:hypothetical protein